MLDKIKMPDLIADDLIELHARNNHCFDNDLWHQIDENRLFLRQYLLWVDQTNSLKDCATVTDMFIEKWNNADIFAYSIVLKQTGKAIGSIDIHNIDYDNYSAEIGYWLSQAYNGCGYVSRSVQLIEKHSFLQGINRLSIVVQAENLPSIRVAEHNHYIYEGTLKKSLYKYGAFYDKMIYAKLK